MKITGFRINGFKSFADPAEFLIAPGMTGIVGPNGCGKSNVIESFRWSMGETSAKSMRADGMDDVIFSGTDIRAPKGYCEVVTVIDNAERTAPVEFNDADILEVSRRLDRGDGSSYKVNGKAVKAKDVRVLYKDAGLGSSSSALVSQGKVAAIISAKPLDRKQVLEEAAGVTGIASRRHEADLRLRATEQNLEQAESLEKGLGEQQASLRRQARQAKFRQEVDDLIRAAEATAFLVRWRAAEGKIVATRKEHEELEVVIKDLMTSHIRLQVELEATKSKTAPIIKARTDAEMNHALATAKLESLKKEFESTKRQLSALEKTIARTASDLQKSRQEIGDSAEEYENLKDELALALDDKEYDAVLLEEANIALLEIQEVFEQISNQLNEKSSLIAGVRVEWQAANKAVDDVVRRLDAARIKVASNREKIDELKSQLEAMPGVLDVINGLQQDAAAARAGLDQAEERLRQASIAFNDEQAKKNSQETMLSVLESELKAIQASLSTSGSLIADVTVRPGYEVAFAAAMGSDVEASIGDVSGKTWLGSGLFGSAPAHTVTILDFVAVPDELRAALSVVGVLENIDLLDQAVSQLKQGQSVVTLDGLRYRWDGFRSPADDIQAENLRRLTRRNQLIDLVSAARKHIEIQAAALHKADADLQGAKAEEADLRRSLEMLHKQIELERQRAAEQEQQRMTLQSRLVSHSELLLEAENDVRALEVDHETLTAERQTLPVLDALERELKTIRERHQASQRNFDDKRLQVEKVKRDADVRIARIQAIEQKIMDFDKRIIVARQYVAELEERGREHEQEQDEIKAALERYPEDEAIASEALEEYAELLVKTATDARACEEEIERVSSRVRQEEEKLSHHREDRARIVAEMKAAQEAASELMREIDERLGVSPDRLELIAGLEGGTALPSPDVCEGRLQSLLRRRDSIGVVNPLAEEQLKEVEEKLGKANAAREELRQTVRRLRDQIAEFDRERRERLLEAFSAIDGHFRELFTRVFGGGRAFLKLSGSEDALEAGLEIYVSPPGKNLQTMSLLSGGEQAMTALALIFAAFLIRPAPVCVLDEVDAALDDANIDRLCTLVEELAGEQTRFLVITHRALTMSRCDRLYGVTMAEKGVSKLTTLDMSEAEAYVQARQGAD